MACEFSGQADSLKNFYQTILDAADATIDVDPHRWRVDMQKVPDLIKHGGYLKRNPWSFDAHIFSISPKEAARMDPQHRILLEHTYHALEDAHIDPNQFKGTRCGVFIGLGTLDYSRIMHASGDLGGFFSKGSLGSMAAGRIAYHFDLIGPNFVVDTACSSSLVALHQALQSLHNDECDIAIVGGTTLILTNDYNLDLANAGLMAKDGRCKPFSYQADGFARGEGVGVIILQKHADALRDKRRIYANILGSAINSDGKSNGITAPSKEAQKRVIQDALTNANLSSDQITLIETHGTGTNLGDKIEFSALCDIFRDRETPLYIGSVKGNIAHCEAAAGLAGIIKVSLCMYHNIIPPHTAAETVNSDLRRDNVPVEFPKQPIEQANYIAGISSFGMSGSNAHAILGSGDQEVSTWGEYQTVFARTELMPDYLKNCVTNTKDQTLTTVDTLRKVAVGPLNLVPMRLELQINIDLLQSEEAYIAHHIIYDQPILPGSYYVETSIALIQKLYTDYIKTQQPNYIEIKNLFVIKPICFEESTQKNLKIVISKQTEHLFQLTYYCENPQELVCEVHIRLHSEDRAKVCMPTFSRVEKTSADSFYQYYAMAGVNYGALFKKLSGYYVLDDSNIIAEILPSDSEHHTITHALFLDNCLQTIGLSLVKVNHAYAPTNMASLIVYNQDHWNQIYRCHTQIVTLADAYLEANFAVYNDKNELMMLAKGVVCQAVDIQIFKRQPAYAVQWQPVVTEIDKVISDQTGTLVCNFAKTDMSFFSSLHPAISCIDLANLFAGIKLKNDHHLLFVSDPEAGISYSYFSEFYNAFRLYDDAYPGCIKKLTIISCGNISALMRAMVLTFPTEFPSIEFRYFCYDELTTANAHYLLQDKLPSLNELTIPFWEVKSNRLYQYQMAPVSMKKTSKTIQVDGYYLITGGLGGVGKQLLQYMVEFYGIKNVIITYVRPEALIENEDFLDEMKAKHGVFISCKHVDVADPLQLQNLLDNLPRPLRGIFHLAGITIDQSLSKVSAESMAKTFAVKVGAARMMHEFSFQVPELEYFVLFSSLAALVSSPGQFSYALANIGLIDLADMRHNLNLPVTVIDWGPWADTGMMANLSGHAHSSVAARDFLALDPKQCCVILFSCITELDHYHFAVFKSNKQRLPKEELETKFPITEKKNEYDIQSLLIQLIAEETDHEIANIDDHSRLSKLGLDSINTIRIRSELQNQLNISVPLSLLLSEQTVGTLRQAINVLWQEKHAKDALQDNPISIDIQVPNHPLTFYPLSANQFSIWFEQQAHEKTTAYHCSIGWKIEGATVYRDQLQKTWQTLLHIHPLLRAIFIHKEGVMGYEIVSMDNALVSETLVMDELSEDVVIHDYFATHLARTIDLTSELATKVFVISQNNKVHLMLSSHHIVMDAAAIFQIGECLLRALSEPNYMLPASLAPAAYHEFTEFQRQYKVPNAEQFLLRQILNEDNELRTFELPKKDTSQVMDLTRGGTIRLAFTNTEMQNILSIPANMRVHLCVAAWALLLAKYTDEREILVGIAFNGRTQKKWTDIIGHFVNVLPLCMSVQQNIACSEYVEQIRSHLIELMEYQDMPLLHLMLQEKVKAALQGRKLLQTYFNFFDASELELKINNPALQIEPLMYPQQEAQFELSLWVTQNSDSYTFEVKYQADLFSEKIIANISEHYKRIILQLGAALLSKTSESTLCDIKLLTDEEERTLLPVFPCAEPRKLVYDYFIDYVKSTPEAIAIEWLDKTINYQQLATYINTFSTSLAAYHQQVDEVIGILTPERATVEFIIAVFALWQKGYAFLPVNMHHPVERIKYSLDTVFCKKIITISRDCPSQVHAYVMQLPDSLVLDIGLQNNVLNVQILKNNLVKRDTDHSIPIVSSNLAYVLFTSGSTGLPKGVLVEQGGLIDRLLWMKKYFNYSAQDKFLQSTMVTFDVSLPEYCLPLICGGTTVLFDSEENPQAHAELCTRHRVTMMSTVPSLFSVLQDSLQKCDFLQHIIMIGEVLPPANVNQWLASGTSCKLYNLYGPTEVTIYATAYECHDSFSSTFVPIGSPCDNVIALVLDSYGNLVPEGVVGELYLSGTGVARGYIGGQIKTNPFADNPYQSIYPRLYRTGDFVRWLSTDNLEYIGRRDNRVKLHGLLVELGEIEQQVLQSFPQVKNACALIATNTLGSSLVKHIVLLVTPHIEDSIVILDYLQRHLPHYMVPRNIISLPDFPRNSNGKIDRKLLSTQLSELCRQVSDEQQLPIQPRHILSSVEQACLEIWEQLLQKKNIGLNANFFQLGGDSLLLTQMTLLIEQRLAIKINFSKFLANPTIDSLLNGVHMQSALWGKEFQLAQDIVPFTHFETGRGVFLTGVTGHLGIHILHALLKQKNRSIYLVVKAASMSEARARVMQRYNDALGLNLDCAKLHIYCGNLAHPFFDLNPDTYANICANISIIIHAAAEVNHVVDYERLKTNNVIVTHNLLRLANDSKSEHICHISTQFSEINSLPERYLDESEIKHFVSGYEQSKFMAEYLMRKATDLNYPITTIRLPLVINEQDPLLLRQNHFVALIMKCMRMGYYPDLAHAVDIMPTEQIASFIAQACETSSDCAHVYNCRTVSFTLSELFERLNRYSEIKTEKRDYEFWRMLVINTTDSSDPFYKLLPLYTTLDQFNRMPNIRKVDNASYLSRKAMHEGANAMHIETITKLLYTYFQKMIMLDCVL